jgi:hypothetical protein
MNRRQKILTALALLVFMVTVVFAPWQVTAYEKNPPGWLIPDSPYKVVERAPIWSPPANGHLLVASLLGTWAAIGIGYAGMFFLLKTRPK